METLLLLVRHHGYSIVALLLFLEAIGLRSSGSGPPGWRGGERRGKVESRVAASGGSARDDGGRFVALHSWAIYGLDPPGTALSNRCQSRGVHSALC